MLDGDGGSEFKEKEVLVAATKNDPAGVTVVLDVAAEAGDGEHGLADRLAGQVAGVLVGAKDLELEGCEQVGCRRGVVEAREVAEREELPGDGSEYGEGVV